MPTIKGGIRFEAGKEVPQKFKDAVGEQKIKDFIAEKFNLTHMTPEQKKEIMGDMVKDIKEVSAIKETPKAKKSKKVK